MPDRERVIEVVREWVGKAENDLIAAAYTLRIGAGCPTDTRGTTIRSHSPRRVKP